MTKARIAIGLWLLGLLAAGLVIVRTPVSTDMSAFLPRGPDPAQRLLVDQLREGVASRLVLLAITRAAPATLAALSRALAERLRADGSFAMVSNGGRDGMDAEARIVWANRYLLSPAITPAHFSATSLHAALAAALDALATDLAPLLKRMLPADPTGEMQLLLGEAAGAAQPALRDGAWVSADGGSALLMVSTRAAGLDIAGQAVSLAQITAAFTAARETVPDAGQALLTMTGPPVFAVHAQARTKSDAQWLSAIATALVALVLLAAYRAPVVLVLALLPVASGAAAGVVAVALCFGFVHAITLGFGVTLIGEAVDYAIYLFTQTEPGTTPEATLRRIWPILRLGMLTSVCGFAAMLASRFTGFAQLGLFTIAGLVTALAVTRFVLPVLTPKSLTAEAGAGFARPILALMRHRNRLRWAVAAVSLAALLSVVRHGAPFWQDQLASMSPVPSAELAEDARLRAGLAAPDAGTILVITQSSREAALLASEQVARMLQPLVREGLLAGFSAPSAILPSEATQRARRAALPEPAILAADLAEAARGMPWRAGLFAPFLADVAQARDGPLLDRADLDGTALALQLDTLLQRHGDVWTVLLPLRGVADAPALAARIEGFAVPGLVFLDLKRESDRLLARYRGEALALAGTGLAGIVALLAAGLRSPARVALVLLPLAVAVLCTTAVLLAGGRLLTIFDLFGLLLVVAVGSNYCLFLEHEGGQRPRMVASLALADLCTVIGFGVLAFSQTPVLHGIGETVAIGACLSLLCGAVLIPARA